MSKFYVDVQFKKQGCFSVEVLANDKQEATQKALNLARNCGYDDAVKKNNSKGSLIMFLMKLAAIAAFIVCLLVICMLVKAISDQQKQMLILKRKNELLTSEMNQREDVLGLEADFEAVLKNDN